MIDDQHPNAAFFEMIEKIERNFYADFDPFYFWIMADRVHTASPAKLQVHDENREVISDHPLNDRLERAIANYDKYASYTVRALRYFSSETLMLLLLSAPKSNPFPRTASVLRGDRLLEPIRSIASGNVPDSFSLSRKGVPIGFNEWVSFKLFSNVDLLSTEQGSGEIIDLVREEAELLSERGAINAYKHGKPVSYGEGIRLQMKGEDGEYVPVSLPLLGLNWIDWYEKPAEHLSIAFGTEELDPESDKKRIFATSLLMDSICQVRLAYLDGKQLDDIQVPINIEIGNKVKRQKFKFNLDAKKDER
ncbi:hypothetical protein [Thalassovita aquimarina]|uniref:Uncharacterized protein n=1 Tax=Thalassovita aquimarina TaxID=2785917 RepID=A0ABS5HQN0_9RHOB|nr:hypothetical protein [Thalassovita aquimarina]MBR9651256.1 hypothetical protein [Thalassovita aquimarina]